MIFSDNAGIRGHLTIIKRDVQTKEETVWFDDHNIIVSGMGYNIATAFAASCDGGLDCANDRSLLSERLGCQADAYKIDHFQVGTSGVSAKEVVGTYSLGNALKEAQYGQDPSLLNFHQGSICSNGVPQTTKTFVEILEKTYYAPNALMHYMIFDETACNGVTLNEVALFSYDPLNETDLTMHHMVAYRVFNPIVKDSSFELLIRWVIYFGIDSGNC